MTDDVIHNTLLPLLRDGIMVVALKEALAAKGLVIQSAGEADARVAAAEHKGMERAVVIMEARAASHAVDAATLPSDLLLSLRTIEKEARDGAAAIRAEMDRGA